MVIQALPMTVEAFEEYMRRPENTGRHFQLINGEIIEDMPIPAHGLITHILNILLGLFVREHKLGWIMNEVRCKLDNDTLNSRIPDLVFISKDHGEFDLFTPLPFIPDLVIEVKSPGDTYAGMRERAGYYLAHGAKLVWLVYPEKQQIEVFPAEDIVSVLGKEGELTGGDVLPGFAASVREIFDI